MEVKGARNVQARQQTATRQHTTPHQTQIESEAEVVEEERSLTETESETVPRDTIRTITNAQVFVVPLKTRTTPDPEADLGKQRFWLGRSERRGGI
jgi:hypothetical protein